MSARALGAALPKGVGELRQVRGGNHKVECFACGDAIGYFTLAQMRKGMHPCRCGAPSLYPSRLDVCAEVAPHLVATHPAHVAAMAADTARERREIDAEHRAAPADVCAGCGHERSARGNPDFWRCGKCGGITQDGAWFHARAFGNEHEVANGLLMDGPARGAGRHGAQLVTRADHDARVRAELARADAPF